MSNPLLISVVFFLAGSPDEFVIDLEGGMETLADYVKRGDIFWATNRTRTTTCQVNARHITWWM